jgi:hypothetical protein
MLVGAAEQRHGRPGVNDGAFLADSKEFAIRVLRMAKLQPHALVDTEAGISTPGK